jgi:hypothetical protein
MEGPDKNAKISCQYIKHVNNETYVIFLTNSVVYSLVYLTMLPQLIRSTMSNGRKIYER